ncbi:MAG: hypothetical protein FWG99_01705 [Treponema sp.]|nr:hypothetical protein [Treponema sp.]
MKAVRTSPDDGIGVVIKSELYSDGFRYMVNLVLLKKRCLSDRQPSEGLCAAAFSFNFGHTFMKLNCFEELSLA